MKSSSFCSKMNIDYASFNFCSLNLITYEYNGSLDLQIMHMGLFLVFRTSIVMIDRQKKCDSCKYLVRFQFWDVNKQLTSSIRFNFFQVFGQKKTHKHIFFAQSKIWTLSFFELYAQYANQIKAEDILDSNLTWKSIACYQNVFENQLFTIICKKRCSYQRSNIDFN